jgi:MOSC domain-containing protein YiiM
MGSALTGSIVQINISHGGVPKRPVPQARATALGLAGDSWAHPSIHGGPDQAILIVCAEAVDELAAQGFPVFYGALGENLTTRGLDRRQLRGGQRFRAGEAMLELTKPRGPCSTLDVYGPGIQAAIYDKQVKARDPASPRWGISGFYAAVVRPGVIRQSDIIVLVDQVV